jgi:hypothetical protein
MFNRNNAPTPPTLEAVCRGFGITLAQFFAEGDEPTQLTEEQRILFSRWSPLTGEQKRLHGCEPPFVGGFFQAAIHPINKLSNGLN